MISIKIIDIDCSDGIFASIDNGNPKWFFGVGVMEIIDHEGINDTVKVSVQRKISYFFTGLPAKGVELEILPND